MSIASIIGRIGNIAGVLDAAGDIFGAVRSLPTITGAMRSPVSLPGTGFATGGSMANLPALTGPVAQQHQCPTGYHYAKDGSGRLVKNRRMNPCNPQALRRSIRRVKAFRKIAGRLERSLPTRTVRSRR